MDVSNVAAADILLTPAPSTTDAAGLIELLRSSPDAVAQLLQRLKVLTGGQPQDVLETAITGQRQDAAAPDGAVGAERPGSTHPGAVPSTKKDLPPATSSAGPPALHPAALTQESARLQQKPDMPASSDRPPGAINNLLQATIAQADSPSITLPASQAKQLLMQLLSQSQQPQPQPQQQALAPPRLRLPQFVQNIPTALPARQPLAVSRCAAPAVPPVIGADLPAGDTQEQLVDQLRTSLCSLLTSAAAPQQQPQPQQGDVQGILKLLLQQQQQQQQQQGQLSGRVLSGVMAPQNQTGMDATVDIAALAAAMGLGVSREVPGNRGLQPVAMSAPKLQEQQDPAAAAATTVSAAAFAQLLPAAAGRRLQQPPQPADQGYAGGQWQAPPSPPTPQQQNGLSMPALLDRLRAVVLNSTQASTGAFSAEQQRLLSMVDQLQLAWASMGGDSASAAASARGSTLASSAPLDLPGAARDSLAAAGGVNRAMRDFQDSAAAAAAAAGGDADTSGLYMLLEAVQQQALLLADNAAASNGHEPAAAAAQAAGGADGVHGAGMQQAYGPYQHALAGSSMDGPDAQLAAAAGWDAAYGQMPAHMYEQYDERSYQQGQAAQQQAGSRKRRSWAAGQNAASTNGANSNNLAAAVVAAMMREEGMAAEEAGAQDPLMEQKWLLKPRARGKRQVKPNKAAFTGEVPSVTNRWANRGSRGGGSSSEDELWKPPRVRGPSKKRRVQGQSEDGGGPSDEAGEQQSKGPGSSAASKRGYGWQLLQEPQGKQQQDQQQQQQLLVAALEGLPDADAAAAAAAAAAGAGASAAGASAVVDVSEQQGQSRSDSGVGEEEVVEGEEAGAGAANGTAAAGGKPRARPAVRKDRWVPPTEEWTTDDGVKVWPKDTQICPAARVFYVAYKWVEQHWPDNLDAPDNHITAHPIRFFLDGQDTEVELMAKLRLYRKAVHLVISPYSALSKKFVRKWLAGYGFDPEKQVLRAYLSTLKPKPPKVVAAEDPDDGMDLTAAAAAAAEWCFGAAAQFAGGQPLPLDAQQQLAAQLSALASMLQPKAKAKGDQGAARPLPPLPLPNVQLLQQQQRQQHEQEGQQSGEPEQQRSEGASAAKAEDSGQEAVQPPGQQQEPADNTSAPRGAEGQQLPKGDQPQVKLAAATPAEPPAAPTTTSLKPGNSSVPHGVPAAAAAAAAAAAVPPSGPPVAPSRGPQPDPQLQQRVTAFLLAAKRQQQQKLQEQQQQAAAAAAAAAAANGVAAGAQAPQADGQERGQAHGPQQLQPPARDAPEEHEMRAASPEGQPGPGIGAAAGLLHSTAPTAATEALVASPARAAVAAQQ